MHERSIFYRALRGCWRKVKLVRLGWWLFLDQMYDRQRYKAWSHGTGSDRTQTQALHAIYKSYHGIEKGLSLSAPRANFGVPKIKYLITLLREYTNRFEADGVPAAVSALHSYCNFNAEHGQPNAEFDAFIADHEDTFAGGTKQVTRAEIATAAQSGGADFFWSRHSVRQYAQTPVSMELIRQAVDMARKTPSVCNRQGPRVHVFENAQEALDLQPGNKGFGHLASKGLVVTSDIQAFSGTGERNQPFVDGGMFAMSLLYTLHSLGLGACPLAWSVRPDQDRKVRRELGIPDNEVIIMMISVGHLPDELQVAKSDRFSLERYIVEHPAEKTGSSR